MFFKISDLWDFSKTGNEKVRFKETKKAWKIDKEIQIFLHSSKHAEFPAFTICPQYRKGYKEKLLKNVYGLNVSDIMDFNYPSYLSNSQDFFGEVTYNISEFIKSVKISTADMQPDIKSRHLRLNILSDKIKDFRNGQLYNHSDFFTSTAHVYYGQCFTLEVKPTIKSFMVKYSLTIFHSYQQNGHSYT